MLVSPYNRSLRLLVCVVHLKHLASTIIHFSQHLTLLFLVKRSGCIFLDWAISPVIKQAVDLHKLPKQYIFTVLVIYQWLNFHLGQNPSLHNSN